MPLLKKVKSLLGLGDESSDDRREGVGVTVEREPAATTESDEETTTGEPVVDSDEPAPGIEEETTDADVSEGETPADVDDEHYDHVEPSGPEAEEATDEEGETPATADEPATGVPVQEIKGIGPSYAEKLADAGVDTVEQLATADADELADATGLSETRIEGWIERARSERAS